MNKDNYIRLLEKENQEYFEKAIKTMKDCCCYEIPELNGEINELLDDLNDLQADWAERNVVTKDALWGNVRLQAAIDASVQEINDLQADWATDHIECRKTLEYLKSQNTRECDLNVRLQGKIAGLQSGATKPQLDPDFINEGFAITFNSELEYWSFMELCWGANLEWIKVGDPREDRPKDFVLMAHAVSCIGSHLEFATPVYYECELGYEIIKASDYLGVKQ